MTMRSIVAAATALRWPFMKAALATGLVAAVIAGAGGSAQARMTATVAGQAKAVAALPDSHPAVKVVLSELSCKGRAFCLAIGHYSKPGHLGVRLVEEWNGETWRIARDPLSGVLYDLTCGSPSFCLALRTATNRTAHLAEWNGRTWQDFKDPLADQGPVTCASPTFCVTVDQSQTGILGWNGKHWSEQPGSDCGGYAPDCSWDSFITCGSATNCDVGGAGCQDSDCDQMITFDFFWNGHVWNPSNAGPAFPANVAASGACAGEGFCIATAAPRTATFTRDWGATWHDASPDLAAVCHGLPHCALNGGAMACGTSRSCLQVQVSAVFVDTRHPPVSLAWNGATWTAAQVARVNGHIPTLTRLDCGSTGNCVVLGIYKPTRTSYPRPIAEQWNGKSWQVTPIAVP